MKKIILLFTIILTSNFSVAQDKEIKSKSSSELDISYYSTHTGDNISVEYNRNIKRHTFIIGLKCHLNRYIKPTGAFGNAYYKQFYADNTTQYVGASIGYEYHLKDINPYVSPYLLFNSQCGNLNTMHRIVSDNTLEVQTYTDGPYITFENTIGAGLSIKLNNRFSLNQSAGIGAAFFFKQSSSYWTYDPTYQWRIGVSIKLY